MFTTFDKALVALIMAVISIVNIVFGVDLGIPVDAVNMVVAAITPFLVYYFPNKQKVK